MWKLLSEFEDEILYRGCRIRVEVSSKGPEDPYVDFMVFHGLHDATDGFSLLRVSGYKAGHIGVTFPGASKPVGHNGISTRWLRKNWKKWMPVNGKAVNIWIGDKPPRANPRRKMATPLPRKRGIG